MFWRAPPAGWTQAQRTRDETFRGQTRTVQHGWIRNGAGYRFHNWYGFGGVHARLALSAARRHMPGSLGAFRRSGWFAGGGGRIPDNRGGGVTTTLDVAGLPVGANIEATVVEVEIDHPFPHDLGIELRSPDGTPSILNPVFQRGAGDRPRGRTAALAASEQCVLWRSAKRGMVLDRV